MAYVPPHLRNKPTRVSPIVTTNPEKVYRTIAELLEQERVKNYGKADGAWVSDDGI